MQISFQQLTINGQVIAKVCGFCSALVDDAGEHAAYHTATAMIIGDSLSNLATEEKTDRTVYVPDDEEAEADVRAYVSRLWAEGRRAEALSTLLRGMARRATLQCQMKSGWRLLAKTTIEDFKASRDNVQILSNLLKEMNLRALKAEAELKTLKDKEN